MTLRINIIKYENENVKTVCSNELHRIIDISCTYWAVFLLLLFYFLIFKILLSLILFIYLLLLFCYCFIINGKCIPCSYYIISEQNIVNEIMTGTEIILYLAIDVLFQNRTLLMASTLGWNREISYTLLLMLWVITHSLGKFSRNGKISPLRCPVLKVRCHFFNTNLASNILLCP